MVGATTISKAYKEANHKLSQAGFPSSKLETLVLLCCVLECDKSYIYAHGDDLFPEDKLSIFTQMLTKRIAHIPLQYISGWVEFMSLRFSVSSAVLIPRQDTEILVESILDKTKSFKSKLCILDIGTGSGCIAISLAHYLQNCHITAIDISREALNIAKKNAIENKVHERISFIESDLFSNVGISKFDIIVSNPPYIPSMDILSLMPEVRLHEPLNALDGGIDGFDFYKNIITGSPSHLMPRGILAFEAGINQANEISSLMKISFTNISLKKDLSGIDRVVLEYLGD